MNAVNNYPSCIKVPALHSKQGMATTSHKDVQALTATNYELISVANRIFGVTKWSHSVTSQTLDYVESILGKFMCGCVTFVRIQLENSTFHEDMGYYCSEASTKAVAIQAARLGSFTNAFEKVLVCFGNTVESEVNRVLKLHQKPVIIDNHKEESRCSLPPLVDGELLPCAQSTPYIGKKDNIARAKSPNNMTHHITHCIVPISKSPINQKELERSTRSNSKSPIDQRECKGFTRSRSKSPVDRRECKGSIRSRSKTPIDKGDRKGSIRANSKSPIDQREQKGPTNSSKNQNQLKVTAASFNNETEKNHKEENLNGLEKEEEKKALSEEELLRQERKRKQMEKQAEYKRLLKEKELQKVGENIKPNPKY